MAFEDCTVFRVWDYEKSEWFKAHTRSGVKTYWESAAQARRSLAANMQYEYTPTYRRITKEEREKRFSVIECDIVPKPTDMQTFKAL